jgi:hypothetical protein
MDFKKKSFPRILLKFCLVMPPLNADLSRLYWTVKGEKGPSRENLSFLCGKTFLCKLFSISME